MDDDDTPRHLAFIIKHQLIGAGEKSLAQRIKPITKEEAVADYEALRAVPCKKLNPRSKVGNTAMDYFFFDLRLQTKAKGGMDFATFYRRRDYLRTPSAKRLYEYNITHGKPPIVSAYDVFRLYRGSINAFKPIIAKELYCRYNPKTILDFSAGWGGRCLGAMSLDIDYIGFDTNKSLKKAYDGMVRTYPSNSKVKMEFRDSSSVDYSKYDYDFVFTSPPYFQKTKPTEEYKGMPTYESREDFNERFFFPVVRNAYGGLKTGGHFALNIPKDMYADIKKVLGKATKKHTLYITPRYSGQPPVYGEFIYVWKKSGALKGSGKGWELPESLPAPTFTNEWVEVKKSPIHGRGLFAKVDIPKGTRIADYKGEEMKYSDYKEKYGDDLRYSYLMRRKWKVLDGKPRKYLTLNPSHYANEGRPVNAELKSGGLVAKRNIKAGTELLLKYPDDYPRTWKK